MGHSNYIYVVCDPTKMPVEVFAVRVLAEAYVHSIIEGYRHKEIISKHLTLFWLSEQKEKCWSVYRFRPIKKEAED